MSSRSKKEAWLTELLNGVERPRFYALATHKNCLYQCDYCGHLGKRPSADQSSDQLERSLEKARSGSYAALLLPCNGALFSDFSTKFEQILASGIPLILELHQHWLEDQELLERLSPYWEKIQALHLVLDSFSEAVEARTQELQNHLPFYLSFVVTAKSNLEESLGRVPREYYPRVFFCFPIRRFQEPLLLDPLGVERVVRRIQDSFPDLPVRPEPGVDSFEPLIPEDRNLEPLIRTAWERNSSTEPLRASVIIPTYNNKDYLINVVHHLARQDLDPKSFEVIVVDDGSNDDTEDALRTSLENIAELLQIKYIYFPRSRPRKMGDAQFRAGVARNLGVKHSRGDLLVFLDSDILVPEFYLRDLLEQHREYDVVQSRRIQLLRSVSSRYTNYSSVEEGRDTYVTDEGYWESFQTDPRAWEEMPRKWRFVCTFGLSLPRRTFERAGWIRKNYTFYGYEDTELGLDLARLGCRFLLSPLRVFHLDHRTDRSEFFNLHHRKKLLLAHSAQTFYLNTLDAEVFSHLEWLFQPGLRWRVMVLAYAKPLLDLSTPMREFLRRTMQALWRLEAAHREKRAGRSLLRPFWKSYYFMDYQVRKRILRN